MRFADENRENGILCVWFGPSPVIFVFRDDYVQDVLGSLQNLNKHSLYKFLRPWLGCGVMMSPKSRWVHSSKILKPSFNYNILNCFVKRIENQIIDERSVVYQENMNSSKEEQARRMENITLVDTFFDKYFEGKVDKKFMREELENVVFGGTDTMSTTLQWIILLVSSYPDVQKKLQEEIDVFFRQKLAYLQLKIILSGIFQKYNIKSNQKIEEVLPSMEMVLRPSKDIYVTLTHRQLE
ncbi:cytochrome P450 4A12B [Octopus bimaculoides]|uniref:cytochrome P450 4A12B n=1 Tax=Octopus bimaculoides TaxID=37653 RepID=UPI0022E5C72B|nr:cytochrome P450 4A12B [Octopus bimaculoides]